jgi:hypothetical protein
MGLDPNTALLMETCQQRDKSPFQAPRRQQNDCVGHHDGSLNARKQNDILTGPPAIQ